MRSKTYAIVPGLIILSILLLFSFLYNLAFTPIHLWDEGRVVVNALNMHLNGNWMVTYFDGKPDTWNTKPPLLIWLQVISMKMFGVSEWSVRFPSAMASILTGLTLFIFGLRYFKRIWPGFLAGCIFACTYPYVFNHAGRTGDYDALLALFITLYCLCFYTFCKTSKNKWLISFFTFLILAVLTKGVAGLFPAPALFIYAILQKKLIPLLKNKWLYIGIASFLLIDVGYYFLRDYYSPGYIKAVLEGELATYPNTLNGHNHPFSWYITNMVDWRYPYWFLFIVPAFICGFLGHSRKVKDLTLFNFITTGTFVLIISTASTKLYWYDVPVYSFLSIQIALMLYSIWLFLQKRFALSNFIQRIIVAAFLFVVIFIYPLRLVYTHNKHIFTDWPWDLDVEARNEALFMQQAIRNKQDLNNYVFCYDACNDCHGPIDFYIILLQSRHVNVQFQNHVDSLKRGKYIVVSQPQMKQKLESSYPVQLEKEAFGCYVYTIK